VLSIRTPVDATPPIEDHTKKSPLQRGSKGSTTFEGAVHFETTLSDQFQTLNLSTSF
jgi:hypothetical protein